MGVIQSAVNQAVGAAGEAIRDVKVLQKANQLTEGQQKLSQGQSDVATGSKVIAQNLNKQQVMQSNPQMTEEEAQIAAEEEVERQWEIAKQKSELQRQRLLRMNGEMQSTKDRLKNLKDLKERERLKKSPLGGDLNG